jgi:micrococcal nuclease
MNFTQKIILLSICLAVCLLVYQIVYERGSTENSGTQKTYSTQSAYQKYAGIYTVSRVIDGDTLDVENNKGTVRVRLIGVNTPESVAPNRPDECFGEEASRYVKNVTLNTQVTLELDPYKPEQDTYGRVLAYIRKSDGALLNRDIIAAGYGYEYTYRGESYTYQNEFKTLEKSARENKLGLWAENTCRGKK